jgi:hypothetical protein
MSWTDYPEHSAAAYAEGWEIFLADGSEANREGTWPYQLMKDDEADLLPNDTEAHKLVVAGAKEGKPHHLAALTFLRRESKPELDLIYRSVLGDSRGWEASLNTHDPQLDSYERCIFGRVITR